MNRPSFLEPLAQVTSEMNNQAQADYNDNLADEWDSISFWEWRIRSLEARRWRYVKKAAWSMIDILEVEEIDEGLEEAYERIDELQGA